MSPVVPKLVRSALLALALTLVVPALAAADSPDVVSATGSVVSTDVNGNRTIEVARFGAAELRDLYQVREVIDGLAARLLARNGLSEELDGELRTLLAVMDETEPFQPSSWFEAHLGFHVRIATCCGNSQLHSMLNLIRMTTLSLHGPLHDRAELAVGELEEILRVAQEQHYAIYESIRSGDERSAESHARRHIRATLHSNLIEQATRGTGS